MIDFSRDRDGAKAFQMGRQELRVKQGEASRPQSMDQPGQSGF
jgi:hypothetical protein